MNGQILKQKTDGQIKVIKICTIATNFIIFFIIHIFIIVPLLSFYQHRFCKKDLIWQKKPLLIDILY
jgi:hypothetical protein